MCIEVHPLALQILILFQTMFHAGATRHPRVHQMFSLMKMHHSGMYGLFYVTFASRFQQGQNKASLTCVPAFPRWSVCALASDPSSVIALTLDRTASSFSFLMVAIPRLFCMRAFFVTAPNGGMSCELNLALVALCPSTSHSDAAVHLSRH